MDVGTEMGSILDVRVTRSNGELKGDHVAGPKLVLRLCAIPVNKDDSKLPIKVLVPLLWIVFTAFVSYTMFKLFTGKYVGSIIIGNHLWVLHATLIYTLVARSMLFSNSRILDVMTYCVESGNSAERLSYSNRSIDYMLQKLKHYSWCTSYFVFFGVTLNLCAAGSAIFLGNLYYMLPLSKSIWYLICGIAVWYFYSFGWFLSVLFSGVPSYMLTERVIELVMFVETLNGRCNCDHAKLNCVEEQVPLAAKVDFNVINNWYDDLYAINKILNGCVSGLITATVGICGPLNVFLLSTVIGLVGEYKGESQALLAFWILTNGIVLLMVAGCAARLHSMNKRFMIAMGSLQTVAQYDDRDLALYQCILLKAKATPFGVPFYGTRLLVSYEAIVKVTSVIASIFFFMVSSGIAGRKN